MSINIARQLLDFDPKTMYFNNTIKNKIIKGTNSLFTGINIKQGNIVLNNVCLIFTVKNSGTENIPSNNEKYKCYTNDSVNMKIFRTLELLEKNILSKYCSLRHKTYDVVYSLANTENNYWQFKYYDNKEHKASNPQFSIINRYTIDDRNFKNDQNSKTFVIKISGVWENNGKIGVSYKICSI